MKKITFLFAVLGFMASITSLTAQTHYSCSIDGGTTTFSSGGGSFGAYPWGGAPGDVVIANANKTITLDITSYDEATSGPLFVRFSRVGFGAAPLGWGSDGVTELGTFTQVDFTAGAKTIMFDIPASTLPVAMTADYVGPGEDPASASGYLYIFQVVGDNDPVAYMNFVVDIQEEILSTKDFNKLESAFYSARKDAIVLKENLVGDYKVYDLTGKTLMTGELSREISVTNLKTGGLYFLATDRGVLKFAK